MINIYLSIAGFIIELCFYETEVAFVQYTFIRYINRVLKGFIIPSKNVKVDFTIDFVWDTKQEIIEQPKEKKYFITIFQYKGKKKLVSYYSISIYHFSLVLRDVLQKLLAANNGFMLHASAAEVHGSAYIFLGKSGAGKSTSIMLLKDGYRPLADDSVIIKKENGKYFVYQTPFIEKETWFKRGLERIPVGNIFFLHKADYLKISKMRDKNTVFTQLVKQLFTTDTDVAVQTKRVFEFATENKFYNLYFMKNEKLLLQGLEHFIHEQI
jgi:hypothetical protein